MFGKIKLNGHSGEYYLEDIQGLVDKTERYRDLIRVYQNYVVSLEDERHSVKTKIARLRLRDKLKYVGAKEKLNGNNGFGFCPSELEEMADREEKFLIFGEEQNGI